jgi:hypothetical protein
MYRFMDTYPRETSIFPKSGDIMAADSPKTMLTMPETTPFFSGYHH